jgi:hypothetical protein
MNNSSLGNTKQSVLGFRNSGFVNYQHFSGQINIPQLAAYVQDFTGEAMATHNGLAVAVACAWYNGLKPKWSHLHSWTSSQNTLEDPPEELVTLIQLAFFAYSSKELCLPFELAPSIGLLRYALITGTAGQDDLEEVVLFRNFAAKKIQTWYRASLSKAAQGQKGVAAAQGRPKAGHRVRREGLEPKEKRRRS